jgi:tRNA-binding EMAP/Myf-like protein
MPVIAMEVKTANDVTGSKNLRVYTFINGEDEFTIIANRTNVYEVGNVVAVALVGTKIKDLDSLDSSFEITKKNIFGIESSGIALGRITASVGTKLEEVELVSFGVILVE